MASLPSQLFGSNKHFTYNAEYCLQYMLWILKTKKLSPDEIKEITTDSKILARGKGNFNPVLKKWIMKAISEEINVLNAEIEASS